MLEVEGFFCKVDFIELIDVSIGEESIDNSILIIDMDNPGRHDMGIIERTRARYPRVKMLAISGDRTPAHIDTVIREGVNGYVFKDISRADLVEAIRNIFENGKFFPPDVTYQLIAGMQETKGTLTKTESKVLHFIVQGLTSKEIAEALEIGARTVDSHRFNLMTKLGVKSTAGLVVTAIRQKLIDENNLVP